MHYDPYELDVQLNPYPHYRRLRAEAPVHFIADRGFWVLSRWEDVNRATYSEDFTAARGASQLDPFPEDPSALPPYAFSIVTSDPPEHTRLRRLVSKIFSPKILKTWIPRIEKIASELTADMLVAARDGEADVVTHLARPLPTLVMMDLMGMPREDAELIHRWADDAIGLLPGMQHVGTDAVTAGVQAGTELADYCQGLVDERRAKAGDDDLIRALIGVQNEKTGDRMSNAEIIGHCVALTLGGLETTGSLIANGAVALLRHPDQFALLRNDPELLAGAVEEMLRWDSPVQGTFRTALAPFKVEDVEVPEGARVQLLWGSANRDELRFPDGDDFLVNRPPSGQHTAFGLGIHFCVGAVLARAEARAAFACLRDVPGLELRGEPTLKTALMPVLRGYLSVPISAAS